MKLLIIGAGQIGVAAAQAACADGHRVDVIDRHPQFSFYARHWQSPAIRVLTMDMTDDVALRALCDAQQYDAALLATGIAAAEANRDAAVGRRHLVQEPLACIRTLRAAGIPRLLCLSSAAVYGTAMHEAAVPTVTEAMPMAPTSPYGECKRAFELDAQALWSGDLAILRPVGVFGARLADAGSYASRMMQTLMATLQQHHTCHLQLGRHGFEDMLYNKEVAQAVVAMLRRFPRGQQVFNLGSGRRYDQAELSKILTDVFPHASVTITTDRHNNLPILPLVQSARLERMVEYQPSYPLPVALADYAACWRHQPLPQPVERRAI